MIALILLGILATAAAYPYQAVEYTVGVTPVVHGNHQLGAGLASVLESTPGELHYNLPYSAYSLLYGGKLHGAAGIQTAAGQTIQSHNAHPFYGTVNANDVTPLLAAYGSSAYGPSAYGPTTYGQSTYGQSAYSQPGYGKSAYGQSAYGQHTYGVGHGVGHGKHGNHGYGVVSVLTGSSASPAYYNVPYYGLNDIDLGLGLGHHGASGIGLHEGAGVSVVGQIQGVGHGVSHGVGHAVAHSVGQTVGFGVGHGVGLGVGHPIAHGVGLGVSHGVSLGVTHGVGQGVGIPGFIYGPTVVV